MAWIVFDPRTNEIVRIDTSGRKPDGANVLDIPEVHGWPDDAPNKKVRLCIVNGAPAWLDTRGVEQAKSERWEAVKTERATRLTGSLTVAGVEYDCNQAAMAGAALAAYTAKMVGGATAASYRQLWVPADNSTVNLAADEMIAVGQAAAAYVTGLWGTSQALRKQIDKAKTTAEVDAITWPTG